jgi:tripartite-type tricarboxylate transporter receptor subunit TctC
MIFSRQSMGRPVVAPPGVDTRVAQALRQAFADAMHDPQFIAEGAKMDLELNFVSGTDVQSMVERLYKAPPDVIARAQAIASAN